MGNRKKIISLDVESALALMQEIYNDIVEQKTTATLITKKMLSFMKESEDMSIIGPVIKDQQKILNDCAEKKISLVKLQALLLKQSEKNSPNSYSKIAISEEDKALLQSYINDDSFNGEIEFGKYSST
jgi:hypothetical protein